MPNSPFKFLSAYERADRDIFFGRDEEIDALYQMVFESNLLLVYGESGTGKSSLIQCGLANRFEETDWLEVSVRRRGNLMESLKTSLDRKARTKMPADASLSDRVESLFLDYFKPVYLIFDQFEELFVLGTKQEEADFREALAELLSAGHNCTVILVMREEYIARLYEFEKRIPDFFDKRFRVEAMSRNKAEEVIRKSCERFNISFENPEKNPTEMLDNISAGRSGFSLPYLQVYLDRLYREDLEKTYPNQEVGELPLLEFTTQEIADFGKIGDVLKNFLQEQREEIQTALTSTYPDASPRTVRKVLGAFASLEGTRVPQVRKDLRVPPLTDTQLDFVLQRLDQARILKEEEGIYEIAHDTLALRIAEQRDADEIALLEIASLVKNRTRAFERTQAYMDEKELQLIENYEGQLKEEEALTVGDWDFVAKSQKEVKKKKRNKNMITSGVITVLLIFLAFAGWQWWEAGIQAEEARNARNRAIESDSIAQERADEAEIEKNRAIESDSIAQVRAAEAEEARTEIAQRLSDLQAANQQRVLTKLKEFQSSINKLDFEEAEDILSEAADLEIAKAQTINAYGELIFFYTEAHKPQKAWQLLSQALDIKKEKPPSLTEKDTIAFLRNQLTLLLTKNSLDKIHQKYYPTMIFVEGGTFRMGFELEYPVELSDFEIAKTELTVLQYQLYCKATGVEMPDPPYWGLTGDSPIVYINWYDAVLYANWLSLQKGLNRVYTIISKYPNDHILISPNANGYRLPTEAQWEYAARGGQKAMPTIYAGSKSADSVAWYSLNSKKRAQPVAQKHANELGLYDMSGNVWEWCQDYYGSYPDSLQINPTGPLTGSRRVIRGGSYDRYEYYTHVNSRGHYYAVDRNNDLGFRLTRTP